MSRVSLKDIAARAGVSVATVSLALRGRGNVAKSTADQVRLVAKEMGYTPNPLLSSLASKRFSQAEAQQGVGLAFLEFPLWAGGPHVSATHYRRVLLAEAQRLGYTPSVYAITDEYTPGRVYRELYHRAVQGVILLGNLDPAWLDSEFDWNTFSVVQCARYKTNVPFHMVRPHTFQSVKLVFNQLYARGYTRIGFGVGQHDHLIDDDEERYGAAMELVRENLKRKDQVPVYHGKLEDRDRFLRWVQKHKPDAVIGFSHGKYWWLHEAGYAMPDALGFVALHKSPGDDARIAGALQNSDEIARQSILLLDQCIRQHERGPAQFPMELLIPSQWIEGQSVRAKDLKQRLATQSGD